jgi:hypothetical protein
MHPQTAARLIEPFSTSQGTVLDPFVGSGTVAVEAMLAGRRSIGIDLNPLAVALTRLKTHPGTVDDRARLLDAAEVIADGAEDRRERKAGSTKRYPPEDVEVFEPHVLLELDGLRAGIEGVESELRGALWLVLSALLVKLSKKRGDTSRELGPRRTAAGYTTKLFRKKTSELVDRLEELADALPEPCPRVRVEQDDAMRLVTVPERSVETVVTSPPYGGTYDYTVHHELRFRWLGLDATPLFEGEFGSRRRYLGLTSDEAQGAWRRELEVLFRSLARVVRPRGQVVLVVADSAVEGVALRADELVAAAADPTLFVRVARATQTRGQVYGAAGQAFRQRPRAEHALLLERR